MTNLPSFLSRQFQTTHNKTEWFVPLQKAISGLSPAQAMQEFENLPTIFEIVNHLVYWNERYLKKMKNEKLEAPISNNIHTFRSTGITDWKELCKKAEDIFSGWVKHLETLSEKDSEHFVAIGNTISHNAYHIGQIVMLRKLQGSWDSNEGVK